MKFEKILLESIDEGLDCLGEPAKQAIYFQLKNKYALNKQDIPDRIKIFTKAIEDIFQTGALLLEIKIMKILFNKIGQGNVVIDNTECLDFASYVYALKTKGCASCCHLPLSNYKNWCTPAILSIKLD